MADNDKQEKFIDKENDDPDQNNDQSDDDDSDEDNSYDSDANEDMGNFREDILKPASTRSRIVVELENPKGEGDKPRDFIASDPIIYKIDPYDEVRMQLFHEKKKLYYAYKDTVNYLKEHSHIHPKKRRLPCYFKYPLVLFLSIILIVIFYAFFLFI
jgi:hypothetical protein